jgi:hypothetical protein
MPDFDTVDTATVNAFGEDITYTPNGGGATIIKAIFQSPDVIPEAGVDITFESVGPRVVCKAVDVPTPGHLDTVLARGITYTVKQVEVDESSLVILHLLEQV